MYFLSLLAELITKFPNECTALPLYFFERLRESVLERIACRSDSSRRYFVFSGVKLAAAMMISSSVLMVSCASPLERLGAAHLLLD